MTEYEKTMERLEEMRSRYKDGFSTSDRSFLEALNYRLFSKVITQTGCSDCYRDAYILIRNRLKNDKKMPKQANYILKNGALLHEFGTSKYYSHQVSDEVAEYFLAKNPEDISQFQKFPSDWKERIAKKSSKPTEVEEPTKVEEPLDAPESAEAEPTEKAEAEPTEKAEVAKQTTLFTEDVSEKMTETFGKKRQSRKNRQ